MGIVGRVTGFAFSPHFFVYFYAFLSPESIASMIGGPSSRNLYPIFAYRRSLRRSVMEGNKYLKKQLDSFEDHRPYFTYWTCTVQVLIMLMALITYGFGPVGFNLSRRSGLVR